MKQILLVLLIGLTLVSVACSSTPKASTENAVATIDDIVIEKADFDRNLALVKYNVMLRNGQDYFEKGGDEVLLPLKEQLLNDMIDEYIIIREAEKAGFTTNKEEMDEYFKTYLENTFGPAESPTESGQVIRKYLTENGIDDAFLRRMLERDQQVRQYVLSIQQGVESDEAKVNDLYETKTAQVKGAHILVGLDKKDLADDLYNQLKADPSKFAELAKANSIDGSAANGGDLGYYSRGEMVTTFNDVSFDAEVGVVQPPVESEYGYHIILISEARTLNQMKEAGVEDSVIEMAKRGILQDTIRQEYFARLDKFKQEAKIERFPLE